VTLVPIGVETARRFTHSSRITARDATDEVTNILKSFKDIIRLSGLDPTNLVESWDSTMLALKTRLESGHLICVVLEVSNPKTDALVGRWDVDVVYGAAGDGPRCSAAPRPAPGGGRHHFFVPTSFNIALSSIASANSFFSLAFSSSNAFSRLASDTSRPPYLAFHL
jgi:hypothetical protein